VDWSHWLSIVGRSLAVYVGLLAGLRVGGLRQLAQLEPFDVAVILLVANAVQNAMVGADVTLGGGLVSAATLFAANFVVSGLTYRYPAFRHVVEGSGRVVIANGHFVDETLKREHLTRDDILRIVQERLDQPTPIEDIEKAVLEIDGSVSIVRKDHSMERSNAKLPSRRVRRKYRPATT
jgi:uncharacterized membrane protein YcaP (DUF421 family)